MLKSTAEISAYVASLTQCVAPFSLYFIFELILDP